MTQDKPKTAMMELKDRLIKDKKIFPDYSDYINGVLSDIDNELLEKEKTQIVDAVIWGAENEFGLTRDEAELFYKATYKQ